MQGAISILEVTSSWLQGRLADSNKQLVLAHIRPSDSSWVLQILIVEMR